MSTVSNEFKNDGRAAYELPRLLVRLGDVSSSDHLSGEKRAIVKAAEAHAYNANEVLMRSIESLGSLLQSAGASEDEIDKYDLSNIGSLLKYLAVEAQHLQDVESDMRTIRRAQEEMKS